MYWKSHATDVFIKGEYYDHAGGEKAPEPTVMFNGANSHTFSKIIFRNSNFNNLFFLENVVSRGSTVDYVFFERLYHLQIHSLFGQD